MYGETYDGGCYGLVEGVRTRVAGLDLHTANSLACGPCGAIRAADIAREDWALDVRSSAGGWGELIKFAGAGLALGLRDWGGRSRVGEAGDAVLVEIVVVVWAGLGLELGGLGEVTYLLG